MNWHNEIIKMEQDELAPIFKTDNHKTMKKFRIEFQTKTTIFRTNTEIVEAKNEFDAKNLVRNIVKDFGKGTVIDDFHSVEEIIYKTQNWQDLEQVIFDYEYEVSRFEEKEDEEMADASQEDCDNYLSVLNSLLTNDWDRAKKKWEDMDTQPRGMMPERVAVILSNYIST